MAKPANQSGTKSGTTKKTTAKKPAKAAPKEETGYDWGDGRKVHTVKKSEHTANVKAKGEYGINPNQPLAQPLTAQQAYGMAQASADRVYAPQLQANQQMQRNTPSWYDDYRTRVTASQAAAQTYAQPLLANAQAGVANAGQTTPGLAAGSPQAAIDQQAAQGRQSIAQLGYDTLAAVPAATNAYMSGQSAIASREQPQAQAALLQQYGQLGSQRAAAVTDEYGKLRTAEQNYGIAQSTLNLNTADKAADNALAETKVTNAAAEKTRTAAEKAAEPNKYGIPAAQWKTWSTSHRQRVIDAANKKTAGKTQAEKDAEKTTAADKKKHEAVTKATGAIKTKIADAADAWKRYAGATNPVIDPVTKKQTGTIKPTPSQIKAQLRKDHFTETEIHVMLMLRVGKKLTPADVARLKGQDPNIRIPREWLASSSPSMSGPTPDQADRNSGSIGRTPVVVKERLYTDPKRNHRKPK